MRRFLLPRGIAAAMLEKGNPLHSKYINKAIKGLLANVSKDGKVMNVSGGNFGSNEGSGRLQGDFQTLDSGVGPGTGSGIFSGLLYG